MFAGRGTDISVGDRQSHGARQGVPQALGIRGVLHKHARQSFHTFVVLLDQAIDVYVLIPESGRNNLGEDQPVTEDYTDRPNGPLAEPREGALLGGGQGQAGAQPRPRLRRDSGGGPGHQPQT